jgi:ABC-type polysaccharide/polyol phosphate export permease
MDWNAWMRQIHRWLSIIFGIVVAGIFTALGTGKKPVDWVYYLPLLPVALLVLTGLYVFALPYALKLRGGR